MEKVCQNPVFILLKCYLASLAGAHICIMKTGMSAAAVWLSREDGIGRVDSWLS